MHSDGLNIYLLIYSNASWCHCYVIIVFVYNVLQMDTSAGWCTSAHIPKYHNYLKKEKIDFIEPDSGPQTAPILIPLTMLFGEPFSSESITDENLTRWKNWSER